MSWRASLLSVALATAVCPAFSLAQNNGGGGGGGGNGQQGGGNGGNNGGGNNGGNRQRGNWDPAQMQQRRMDQIKEQMAAPDDEWKVIEPKLTKIMDAQRMAFAGGMGFGGGGRRGGGGPGGGGGGDQPAPTTKVGIAAADLRKAVSSDGSSPEDIDKKIAAYRAARADAQAQLEASRKDLKDVLSSKQEAVLVLNGIME